MADGKPLHILHLTAGSDAGGLSRYIHDLSCAMLERGHTVSVAGEKGAWHWLFEKSPLPWIEIPLKRGPLALRSCVKTLLQWMQTHEVDVLHTHYRRPTLVCRKLQNTPGRRIPILYTLHLSHINLGIPWKWFSDFGDHTHVASADARDWVVNDAGVPEGQVSLIPHGIDVAKFPVTDVITRANAKKALGFTPFDRVAVYVGRLDYPKNEEWMLDVATAAKDRVPTLRVLMVGEGPDEVMLRRSIEERGLEDRVFLLGHQDPLPMYQAADALLLPSQREGFSLVCAEAMSTGIPCLRTRTSGTRELIIDGRTGWSVPIDRKAFVQTAVEFLAADNELKRMGEGAAKHIRENFTFDRQVDQTIALYQKLREGN